MCFFDKIIGIFPITIWKKLILEGIIPQDGLAQKVSIKIKLEIDTRPPLGFKTEEMLLLRPFSFYVKCFTIDNLFAGKIHALLFRKWKDHVKGRDWYDLEWYIKRGTPLNLHHFLLRAQDSGDWTKNTITETAFRKLLSEKIDVEIWIGLKPISFALFPILKHWTSGRPNIFMTWYVS